MDGQHLHQGKLKRGLKNRHIQLIALGGAIGTGPFLGSAGITRTADPSMILGYAIGGFIAFPIMRQLGETIVEEPVAGSFNHFAHKYWGGLAGFLSGWNYWVLYIPVSMSELTVVGKYVQYQWPDVPTWATAAAFFVLINTINLANVKAFGETEFWFTAIKVTAIIGMILLSIYLLVGGGGGPQASVSDLWDRGGFFPNGFSGPVMTLTIIMLSFGGLELVGITAAEASESRKVIPKATNQVIYRILIFYIGVLAMPLSPYPQDQLVETINASGDDYSGSPLVQILSLIGSGTTTSILNFVVLTAALSVYNSGVYCNSRMLYGLVAQGDAPKVLVSVNCRDVPVLLILVSALITFLCVIVSYVLPHKALELLMPPVVAALVINWAMISLSHLKFRAAMKWQGVDTSFKALWSPFSNHLCLIFVMFILGIMLMIPGINISVYVIPFWLLLIWLCYRVKLSLVERHGLGQQA